MINGNDGGATVTFNGGKSWSTILNQPTAQLYHVAADAQTPYRVYAAQQDNTTISVPSRSDHGRITIEEWETVGGGEDGYVAPHPDRSQHRLRRRSPLAAPLRPAHQAGARHLAQPRDALRLGRR